MRRAGHWSARVDRSHGARRPAPGGLAYRAGGLAYRAGGLAHRAVVVGAVLAAAAIFFAALTLFAGPSRPGSVRAGGLEALRSPMVAQDGPGGAGAQGDSGGAPSDGWSSGDAGTAPAGGAPADGPAAAGSGGPVAPAVGGAGRAGGSGRATAQINCTKEVLDESGLKDAVANAG
ncbi:MAG: hypothetical protein QOD82_357, partial [Pseudonocardiales bacterium]|nr:hypothetical protein [Pseudonocardiales bacterium]